MGGRRDDLDVCHSCIQVGCDHCTAECDKEDRHVNFRCNSSGEPRLNFDLFAKAFSNSSKSTQEIVVEYVRLMNIPKLKVTDRVMTGSKGESIEVPR